MATEVFNHSQNGNVHHYFTGIETTCHPAMIMGGFTVTDGIPVTSDLLQLDAEGGGTLVLNDVPYDETIQLVPSWHPQGMCTRV